MDVREIIEIENHNFVISSKIIDIYFRPYHQKVNFQLLYGEKKALYNNERVI